MATSDAVLTALISSIFGGFLVTFTNHLLTREKTKAETLKLKAEAEKVKAESAKILKELDIKPEFGTATDDQLPVGWERFGNYPNDYDMGLDRNVAYSGNMSAYIKSRRVPRGFITLMQIFKADTYRNKRVRMAGYVKAVQVQGWAGLWMRVDGKSGEVLSFDNMSQRPITGNTAWRKYEIILDVSSNGTKIAFGILLEGEGQVWIDEMSFEVVSDDISTTNMQNKLPESPVNLNFEFF